MNVAKYSEKKEKGFIEFKKIGDTVFVIDSTFDGDTGEKTVGKPTAIKLESVQERRETLAKELTELDQIITDIQNAEESQE